MWSRCWGLAGCHMGYIHMIHICADTHAICTVLELCVAPVYPVGMASVANLVVELANIAKLIAARAASLGDAESKERFATNMVNSFGSKLRGLKHFSAESVSEIMGALAAANLPPPHAVAVQTAIDARLDGSNAAVRPMASSSNITQSLLCQIVNYLTEKDWIQLNDSRNTEAHRMQVIAERLKRLGVRFPHEDHQMGCSLTRLLDARGWWETEL